MSNQPAIMVLNEGALPVATQIAEIVGGTIHGHVKRVGRADVTPFDDVRAHTQALFLDGTPIIGVMASSPQRMTTKLNPQAKIIIKPRDKSFAVMIGVPFVDKVLL